MSQANDGAIKVLQKQVTNLMMRLEALEQAMRAPEPKPQTPADFKPKATRAS